MLIHYVVKNSHSCIFMGAGGLHLALSPGSSQFSLKNWEEPGDEVLVNTNLSNTKHPNHYVVKNSHRCMLWVVYI